VSLTGGLDSRMIMACLKARSGTVPCYTFGSMHRSTYDVRVARTVATFCDQPHEVLVLGEKFVEDLRDYFEKAVFISDGYLGLSGAAELYLNGLARRVAPVRITGNYGGELLRGVRAFKSSMPQGGFLRPEMTDRVRESIQAFARMTEMQPLSFTLFRQAPAGYGRYAIERSQLTVRSPFLDDDFLQLLYRSPRRPTIGREPSISLIGERRPDLLTIPTDRGLLGSGGRMAQGLRRIHREGLFKAEYWTGHGAPRWMAALTRQMPGSLIEKVFIGRHKFVHPRLWIRGTLGAYTREVLLADNAASLADCLDPAQVRAMLRRDLQGETNHSDELDKVMTLALASRLLFQSRATDAASRVPSAQPAGEYTI
jgi:asparagine synthase (glutamine-hydrolysing)